MDTKPDAPATDNQQTQAVLTAPELLDRLRQSVATGMTSLGQAHVLLSQQNNVNLHLVFQAVASTHAAMLESTLLAANISGEMRAYQLSAQQQMLAKTPTDASAH
jgi:ribose/xylose/arabinose/galactoside ABC-type transport system permease subunit